MFAACNNLHYIRIENVITKIPDQDYLRKWK